MMGGARSFYLAHYIVVPKLMGNDKKKGKTIKKNMTVMKKKELRHVLDNMQTSDNARNEAIILCGTSSGLGLSELVRLRISDILVVDSNNITTLDFTEEGRMKTGVEFFTFLSPEATTAIWKYIAHRGVSKNYVGKMKNAQQYMCYREGGTLYGTKRKVWESKHNIKCDDDFLFCNGNVQDAYVDKYDGFDEKVESKYRQLTDDGLSDIFRRISIKLGVESKSGNYNPLRLHNFRKFFITILTDCNISTRNVDFFSGKKIPTDKGTYLIDRDLEKLKNTYMTCLESLSLRNEVVYHVENDAIKQVKIENKIDILKLEMKLELKPYEINISEYKDNIGKYERMIEKNKVAIKNKPNSDSSAKFKSNNVSAKKLIHSNFGSIRENDIIIARIKDDFEIKINELEEKLLEEK